jgi:hypothetical protein
MDPADRDPEDSGARRRLERAAELRAARYSGRLTPEETAAAAADDELQEKRRKVDSASRADYLVRDAIAHGKFDNLKYAGKPIPGLGDSYDPDWWVKGLIQREHLSGLGPEAILLRSEDAGLDALLDEQATEERVRAVLEDFNARVVNARRQLQGGPPVTTKTREVAVELERWHARRAAAAAAHPAPPEPPPARPWWRRRRGA